MVNTAIEAPETSLFEVDWMYKLMAGEPASTPGSAILSYLRGLQMSGASGWHQGRGLLLHYSIKRCHAMRKRASKVYEQLLFSHIVR